MSSKYQGLPDIDTAPDIFETADEPEPLLRPDDNGFGDEDAPTKTAVEGIDYTALPGRRQAEKVFGRGTRKPDSFRLQLPPLPRRASTPSSSSSDDFPSSSSRHKESPAARLRRLKVELAEVEAELATSPSASTSAVSMERKRESVLPPKQPVDLMSELVSLREKLGSVDVDGVREEGVGMDQWKERLERLTVLDTGQTAGEDPAEDQKPAMSSSSNGGVGLSELDKRLAQLEDLIGPPSSGPDDVSSPLLPTLGKLDHLLSLLTHPRHLDAISRRVKLLLVDLDRAAAAARSRTTTTQPERGSNVTLSQAEFTELQSLFSLLPRLDPLLPILPPLLARLRSLSGLHADASEVAEGLRRLQADDRRTGEEKVELERVVKGVQEGLGDAARGIERNWEGLETRMRGLEGRIQALHG